MEMEINNPLSQLLLFFMSLITAILHILLPARMEQTVSAFMIGNVFGIALFPFCTIYLLSRALGLSWILPGVFALYLSWIWFLDHQHLTPVKIDRFGPRSFLLEQSLAFWASHLNYFPISVVFDDVDKIDASKQYIIGVHPHGIHCWPLNIFALPTSSFNERFSGMKLTGAAATIIFKIPVVRELFLAMGYRDASRKVCQRVLETGSSLYICTGGEAESLATTNGEDAVVLEGRYGFVRLALSYGCPLIPVFGVGNNELYTTYQPFREFRRHLAKSFHVALPIFHGRWFSPLPYRRPLKVLIGSPIEVPQPTDRGARPSDEKVKEYHAKYVAALSELYAKHAPIDVVDGVKKKRILKIISA